MSKKRENFFLPGRELRIQPNADGSRSIVGIIPYNSPSDGLPWSESIAPGAFADALKPGADVLMLRDHDPSLLLGRTLAGTLTLANGAEGLQFSCTLPNTTTAADLVESMARKDITGVSFGFVDNDPAWSDDGAGNLLRSLRSVELQEISVCSFAAYSSAQASLRSVPKALRSLVKRSKANDLDDDEDDDDDDDDFCPACQAGDFANCTNSPPCNDDDNDDDDDDDDWAERTLRQLTVANRILSL